jgi:hypothetical protein
MSISTLAIRSTNEGTRMKYVLLICADDQVLPAKQLGFRSRRKTNAGRN